jgi:PKD repeat protein
MTTRLSAAFRVAVGGLLSGLLVAGVVLAAPPARADSAPRDPADPATPVTVTADALPTVQINGVVWSQAVVGNTVYVAGQFTRVRPAGAPAGTQETVRNNLLAYDIRTGELITSFAPDLNAQALAVTPSPDGSRIYVGGNFTVANGQPRYRFATYSTATGALLNDFQPSFGAQVRAIAATASTVYVGGIDWGTAGGAARNYLASFSTATGKVTSWAPQVDYQVSALAVVNGGSAVVIAGGIGSLNGKAVRGIGEVDATTGQSLPFAASMLTGNSGAQSAFTGLATDGDTVYASMYAYASGTSEGVLAIDPNGGKVRWVDDCYGDTYSVWASGTAAYIAGHPHYCGNLGGFPQTDPASYYRALAFSKAATRTITPTTGLAVDRRGAGAMVGQPAPELLNWFPDLEAGTYTGTFQGPWSVAGTSDYVVYGGEFPRVNGRAQQGLVRFAVPAVAPNKMGPDGSTGLVPTVTSWSAGTARVAWQTTSDPDNADLTYSVFRSDQPGVPVVQTVAHSTFWDRPTVSVLDRTAPSGKQVTYYVRASDPFGNAAAGPSVSATISTNTNADLTPDDYSQVVTADGPRNYWRLAESTGSTSYDLAGAQDLTLGSGVTLGRNGALPKRANTAATFSGTSTGTAVIGDAVQGPNVFSLEAWFSTTSKTGGRIIGFGDQKNRLSGTYDRHVTIDGTGRVGFGVYNDVISMVQSPAGYNDGRWHHVVATLGGGSMKLYVDGRQAAAKAGVTYGYPYAGYWKVGGDNTWDGSGPYLAAGLDEVAVYPVALSSEQVARHYSAGATAGPNTAPTAAFTSSVSGLTVSVDGSGSTDPEGPVASYAWDFGDGQTGTGKTASRTYAAAGTYPVKLTVTDSAGATGTVTRTVTVSGGTTPPPVGAIAGDAFGREVTGGWGTADAGGAWAVVGTAANAVVTGGSGRLTAPAGTTIAAQLGISARDVALAADVALDKVPSGGGSFVGLGVRNVGANRYNAQLWFAADGTAMLSVFRVVNGAETDLGDFVLPGTYTAGSVVTVRFEASGSGTTALRAKAWASGSPEPTAWQLSVSDSTAALQTAGGLRTELYTSGRATAAQTLRLDNLWVGPAEQSPPAG